MVILQGLPAVDDAPDLVKPCGDKLDPEHLIRDLPKYKPYISASSWQHWEEFLSNLDNIEEVRPQLSWPLTQLYSASIIASTRRKNQEPPADVTPATMTILDKETAPPPPVSNYSWHIR